MDNESGPSDAGPGCVLVAGGTGFVGSIIVRELLARGAQVLIPTRSAEKLAGLPDGAVGFMAGGSDSPDRRRAAALAAGVSPRAVIAALGGWRTGPDLLDTPATEWDEVLDTNLTAHLTALQAYAPLIAGSDDPVYVALNGAAAVQPIPHAGGVCVTGAGQQMLLEVMRVGRLGTQVRFHQLSLMAAVAGDDRNQTPQSRVHPDQIGDAVIDLLTHPDRPFQVQVDGR